MYKSVDEFVPEVRAGKCEDFEGGVDLPADVGRVLFDGPADLEETED